MQKRLRCAGKPLFGRRKTARVFAIYQHFCTAPIRTCCKVARDFAVAKELLTIKTIYVVFVLCFGHFLCFGDWTIFVFLIRQFAVFDSSDAGFLLRPGGCFLCFLNMLFGNFELQVSVFLMCNKTVCCRLFVFIQRAGSSCFLDDISCVFS